MSLGLSLFLIAVGAILRYAVTTTVAGVDIQTIGLILMIVGVVGLIISLVLFFSAQRGAAGPRQPPPPY